MVIKRPRSGVRAPAEARLTHLQEVPFELFQDFLFDAAYDKAIHAQEAQYSAHRRLEVDQLTDRVLLRSEINSSDEVCRRSIDLVAGSMHQGVERYGLC